MPSVSVKDVNQQAFTRPLPSSSRSPARSSSQNGQILLRLLNSKNWPLMMMTGTSLAYQLLLGTSTCVHQLELVPLKRSSELASAVVPVLHISVKPVDQLPVKPSRHWNNLSL